MRSRVTFNIRSLPEHLASEEWLSIGEGHGPREKSHAKKPLTLSLLARQGVLYLTLKHPSLHER